LLLVLFGAGFAAAAGIYALAHLPLDAIPDLSDTQVIVYTEYPGQAPQVIEDQVTYPLTTAMLTVPRSKVVRGFSFFGVSFVYVIFEDGTDIYWARSRVLEFLNSAASRLPAGVTPTMGPDATGVGWVYEYALVDRTGGHDIAELRTLQDWFLKYELKTVPNVAEVASVGGMVRQYPIVLDPKDNVYNSDRNNFAPRFGFAYRPFNNSKTVIRGGAGIYHNPIAFFVGVRALNFSNPPYQLSETFEAAAGTTPSRRCRTSPPPPWSADRASPSRACATRPRARAACRRAAAAAPPRCWETS
jgi:hypothetical protein